MKTKQTTNSALRPKSVIVKEMSRKLGLPIVRHGLHFPPHQRMARWVERKGCNVEFGNIVAAFVGKPYMYTFPTTVQAALFAAYVDQRDPTNPDMPIGVGEKIVSQFEGTRHG